MKTTWIARTFVVFVSCTFFSEATAPQPVHAAQSGILIPDRFRHAEPFIRTLEAGGLVVESIGTTTLEGFLGGGQTAALITTDKGVVEVIVFPCALDAEQLSITYSKWNGNGHHFHIEGPSLRKPEDGYGSQFAYLRCIKTGLYGHLIRNLTESSNAFLGKSLHDEHVSYSQFRLTCSSSRGSIMPVFIFRQPSLA